MNDIFAGIVSFNPDISRLKENICAIANQVHNVVVFDNGSGNQKEVLGCASQFDNVEVIISEKNIGIAAALNRLMQWGYEKNYLWMLSLDHDSVCNNSYVSNMIPYLSVEPKLGIVAPIIVDRGVGVVGHDPKGKYAHVNTCITSGAFTNMKAWKKIGEYDESMFIDSVDFEFCYRMRKNGYGVIQVSEVKLLHELGQSEMRRFLFWKVRVSSHSAFRDYYIAKNNVYYPMKHHLWLHFIRGNFRNLGMLGIVGLYERDKMKKAREIFRGWKDAYKSKIGRQHKIKCLSKSNACEEKR